MMKCGLLGRTLSHSFSPRIHQMLGQYPYGLFETEPSELEAFLKDGDWTGINVTVPYKKDVIPYLDQLTPVAARLGAVNSVVRRDGKLIGHNTDYFGFQAMVNGSCLCVTGKKVLVLGSGGASSTAVAVLEELSAEVIVVSRCGPNHYENLHLHKDAAILVNTTPVGMYPDNGHSPVDLDQLPNLEAVLDVIYNPARTKLLLDAEHRGLVTVNGLLMLVAQAKEATEWFTGCRIEKCKISEIYSRLSREANNIVLIGMPGCGKSTVGRRLAHELGRTFVDSDSFVAELAGMSIPDIFRKYGEDVFRDYETTALSSLGKQSGLVIATGGGCVTKERNYPLLHQNGTIFWLQREINDLPTDGRPLSRQGDLLNMYRQRRPKYEFFGDHIVTNDETIDDCVRQILGILEELQ